MLFRQFRLTGTTPLLFVHGVYGLEELLDLLARFLRHALETPEQHGDLRVFRLEVLSGGLFYTTEEIALESFLSQSSAGDTRGQMHRLMYTGVYRTSYGDDDADSSSE
jgi:hypothetical protein